MEKTPITNEEIDARELRQVAGSERNLLNGEFLGLRLKAGESKSCSTDIHMIQPWTIAAM